MIPQPSVACDQKYAKPHNAFFLVLLFILLTRFFSSIKSIMLLFKGEAQGGHMKTL